MLERDVLGEMRISYNMVLNAQLLFKKMRPSTSAVIKNLF